MELLLNFLFFGTPAFVLGVLGYIIIIPQKAEQVYHTFYNKDLDIIFIMTQSEVRMLQTEVEFNHIEYLGEL